MNDPSVEKKDWNDRCGNQGKGDSMGKWSPGQVESDRFRFPPPPNTPPAGNGENKNWIAIVELHWPTHPNGKQPAAENMHQVREEGGNSEPERLKLRGGGDRFIKS